MERTEGEPDVIGYDEEREEYIFVDCSKESPKGRRSVCYDRAALESRKKHKPENSAIDMATDMGIEMLTEDQYRELQKLGTFDAKTSTWVKTPTDIRERGGALFVISVLGMFSYIIMARNPIMVPVGSGDVTSVAVSRRRIWRIRNGCKPTILDSFLFVQRITEQRGAFICWSIEDGLF